MKDSKGLVNLDWVANLLFQGHFVNIFVENFIRLKTNNNVAIQFTLMAKLKSVMKADLYFFFLIVATEIYEFPPLYSSKVCN